MRVHWQEKLPDPRTSLQLPGTPGRTVSITVIFGGTLDPSLMLLREILNKLKETNLFQSKWLLRKDKEHRYPLDASPNSPTSCSCHSTHFCISESPSGPGEGREQLIREKERRQGMVKDGFEAGQRSQPDRDKHTSNN